MISKKVLAWGMYDFANTIYSALFVTFFFPAYVKNYLHGTEFMIGAVFSISMLLVGLAVPVLGAISDMMKRRMPFIVVFTILNCIAVVLVAHASLGLALLLALAANFFYHAGLHVYNALLPDVAEGHGLGEVSGIGVAMGYLGTLLSLGVAYVIVNLSGLDPREGIVGVFYATSILFFLLSLFTFFGVDEPVIRVKSKGFSQTLHHAASRVFDGVKDISRRCSLRSFLTANFFFTNAMNSVILFLFLYSQETFGLTVNAFFPAYTLFAVGAAAGAFVFAQPIDRFGPTIMMKIAGWIWLAVIGGLLAIRSNVSIRILTFGISPYTAFLLAGTIGGAALGLVWSANRPLLISLVPRNKLGEYFGFLELSDKFSGVLGPVVFGFLATFYGYGWALLSLLGFFGAGLYFLGDVTEGS